MSIFKDRMLKRRRNFIFRRTQKENEKKAVILAAKKEEIDKLNKAQEEEIHKLIKAQEEETQRLIENNKVRIQELEAKVEKLENQEREVIEVAKAARAKAKQASGVPKHVRSGVAARLSDEASEEEKKVVDIRQEIEEIIQKKETLSDTKSPPKIKPLPEIETPVVEAVELTFSDWAIIVALFLMDELNMSKWIIIPGLVVSLVGYWAVTNYDLLDKVKVFIPWLN